VVLSDWNAIGELIPHGCAADLKEAAEQSVLAGVDMGMMADAYHHHLVEPGDFSVWVGHSAAGGLEGAFEVVE
jgi:beta-glucosidase